MNECNHIMNIFLQCPDVKDHLHCFKCGKILSLSYLLTFLTQEELEDAVTIYKTKRLCQYLSI